jgi:hypothetical protein
MEKIDKRGYEKNVSFYTLSPDKNHLVNRVLELVVFRCWNGNKKNYSGEFFMGNKKLVEIFEVSQKRISEAFTLGIDNGWIYPVNKNRKVTPRKFKISDKTLRLIYTETELVLNKEIDFQNLSENHQKSIVENDYEHGQNRLTDIDENDYEHGQNRLSDIDENDYHKERFKEPIKELSKRERENFEKLEIIASGGVEFKQAIQQSGLMEPVKKLIGEAGLDPEKETNSIIQHFGGLDKNNGKSFTPDGIIKRLEGYFKNGIHNDRGIPKIEIIPIRVKAGKMIGRDS